MTKKESWRWKEAIEIHWEWKMFWQRLRDSRESVKPHIMIMRLDHPQKGFIRWVLYLGPVLVKVRIL